MIPPINCPYKGLTAPPCWSCTHHIADTDQCALACIVSQTAINAARSATGTAADSVGYADALIDEFVKRGKRMEP